MYFGQYFFVMGIKNTDALSGSIWQNTIPIFTLVMGLLSGLEKIDMRPHGMAKLAGAKTKLLVTTLSFCGVAAATLVARNTFSLWLGRLQESLAP